MVPLHQKALVLKQGFLDLQFALIQFLAFRVDFEHYLGPSGKLWIQQFPQNLILTISTAVLSYHLIEKPVLSLKSRFVRPDIDK